MNLKQQSRRPIRALGSVMIKSGFKEKANNVAIDIIGLIRKKHHIDAISACKLLFNNISPQLSVRKYKKAAAIIKVPFKVKQGFENFYGIQALRANSKKRSEYGAFNKYKLEALDSSSKKGNTFRYITNIHQEALNNQRYLKRNKKRKKYRLPKL